MKTILLTLFLIAAGFSQTLDSYVGNWKQVDGNIEIDIKKDGKNYLTNVTIDSTSMQAPALKNQLGIEIGFPLEEQSINFTYDEKSKMLVGFWANKNKTLKLVKH